MFEDALLESGGRMKTHRTAATLASLLLQSAFVGLLLLLPLIFVEALPPVDWTKPLELPPAAAPPRGPERVMRMVRGGGSELDDQGRLRAPFEVPQRTRLLTERIAPGRGPSDNEAAPDIGLPNGDPNGGPGILDQLISRPAPPSAELAPRPVVRPSIFMQGRLTHRVVPPYPDLPKRLGIQGPVVMQALISREGIIQQLQVISGHPMLRQPAIDAVKQWRYRPYLLNGQAVEVETQITFNFVLSRD